MRIPAPIQIVDYVWTALGVYWVISARQSGKSKTKEPAVFRLLRFAILGTVFTLLLSPWLRIGPLAWRFEPENPALEWVGAALTVAGVALTAWARLRLGRNWSDKIVIKTDHELIKTGPYAYMRHPIYSGVLLGVAGATMVIGEWRGVLAFCIMLATYTIKAKKEEQVLRATFGTAFDEHMRQTGFLFPRFRTGER